MGEGEDRLRALLADAEQEAAAVPDLRARIAELEGELDRTAAHAAALEGRVGALEAERSDAAGPRVAARELRAAVRPRMRLRGFAGRVRDAARRARTRR